MLNLRWLAPPPPVCLLNMMILYLCIMIEGPPNTPSARPIAFPNVLVLSLSTYSSLKLLSLFLRSYLSH